jgi:hypothetical protein
MRKFFLVFLLAGISLIGFTQANTFVSNTATSFTLDQPCLPIPSGTYTIQLQYFDSGNGNWVPPTLDTYITYTNVQVTTNPGSTVVYDFSSASPSANFPTNPELNQSQGTFYVLSGSTIIGRMNWDLDQLNCPALPVTLTSWNATVPIVDGYKQIHFTWSTASESNSCYYSIEWAPITNQVWQAGICRVPAAGNSSSNINYSFDWLYPQAVDYLFRLKMVDIDGTVKYSTIIRRTISNCSGSNCLRSEPNCSVTINGPNQVCLSTSASYTLSSLNDRGIAWSTSSSLASVQDGPSCTDNGARLNAGSSAGSVILSAKISGCSNTVTKTIQITGSPSLSYGAYFSNGQEHPLAYWNSEGLYNDICNLENVNTNMQFNGAVTSVTWSKVTSSPSNISWSQSGNNLGLYFWGIGQTAVFTMTATNSCGSLSNDFAFRSIDCSGGGGGGCYQYQVSPNPARSSMKVAVPQIPPPCDRASTQSRQSQNLSISEIRIYDQQGFLKTNRKFEKVKVAQVNLSNFKTGIYVVEITDGQYVERQQLIIQN